jgi:hypothetical protein
MGRNWDYWQGLAGRCDFRLKFTCSYHIVTIVIREHAGLKRDSVLLEAGELDPLSKTTKEVKKVRARAGWNRTIT